MRDRPDGYRGGRPIGFLYRPSEATTSSPQGATSTNAPFDTSSGRLAAAVRHNSAETAAQAIKMTRYMLAVEVVLGSGLATFIGTLPY